MSAQTCDGCREFKPSTLAPYGYCRGAPTMELRAALLARNEPCMLLAKGVGAPPQTTPIPKTNLGTRYGTRSSETNAQPT